MRIVLQALLLQWMLPFLEVRQQTATTLHEMCNVVIIVLLQFALHFRTVHRMLSLPFNCTVISPVTRTLWLHAVGTACSRHGADRCRWCC